MAVTKGMKTNKSLRLDVKAAQDGRTWMLLPDGFREKENGKKYPLPTHKEDLGILGSIAIPHGKKDSGAIYLRRAREQWRVMQLRKSSAMLDARRSQDKLDEMTQNVKKSMVDLRNEARQAVDSVHEEVKRAVASLTTLYELAKKGLEGQMNAHLKGAQWQGEEISAKDFRECTRIVTQTVKGMGLPSEDRDKARDAKVKEIAEALRDTNKTVDLSAADHAVDPEEPVH